MKGRNKSFIIMGIILLVVALAVFLIGGAIAGWDFAEFFASSDFVWIMVFLSIYALAVLSMFIYDRIKRL